jgi:acetoin utilization protein AcuB
MGMRRHLAKDWMTPDPITIGPDTTLPEANHLMKECNIRRLLVVEDCRLVGIVTLGDIWEASPACTTSLNFYELHYLIARLTVREIMTHDPITVSPDTSIEAAAHLMLEHKFSGLPVCDGDRLVGVITETDIFRLFVSESEVRSVFA